MSVTQRKRMTSSKRRPFADSQLDLILRHTSPINKERFDDSLPKTSIPVREKFNYLSKNDKAHPVADSARVRQPSLLIISLYNAFGRIFGLGSSLSSLEITFDTSGMTFGQLRSPNGTANSKKKKKKLLLTMRGTDREVSLHCSARRNAFQRTWSD